MMTRHDPLVSEYLSRLRAETADLPPDEREELVSSIAEHIATSLAELTNPTDAEVRAVLDRLGQPAAIAVEARGQSSGRVPAMVATQPDRPGLLEWGGVVMLGLGSCLIPIVGTAAGLIMISLSRWWTTPQKVLAAALSLAGVLLIPLLAAGIFLVPADHGSGSPQPAVSVELVPTPAPSR